VIAEKSLDFSRTRLAKDLRNLREKFGFIKRVDKGWALAPRQIRYACARTISPVIKANKHIMLVLWSLPASKIIYMAFFFFVLAVIFQFKQLKNDLSSKPSNLIDFQFKLTFQIFFQF